MNFDGMEIKDTTTTNIGNVVVTKAACAVCSLFLHHENTFSKIEINICSIQTGRWVDLDFDFNQQFD